MANGKPGAPVGNNNGSKNRIWSLAIQKAVRRRSKSDQLEYLVDAADKLLDCVDEGDLQAMKELGDRLEGKPMQAIERTDNRTITLIERKIVTIADQSKPPIEGEVVTKQLDGANNEQEGIPEEMGSEETGRES